MAPPKPVDSTAILDRHATRRKREIATVSVLAGPVGVGRRLWREWTATAKRQVVVAADNRFPFGEWIRSSLEQMDIPQTAVESLARRANRDPATFSGDWKTKTLADRQRHLGALAPQVDDGFIQAMVQLAVVSHSRESIAAELLEQGESVIASIVRLDSSAAWPSVLFGAATTPELVAVATTIGKWAVRVPAVPMAVAVPNNIWNEYLEIAPECRVKSILKEGEIVVTGIEPSAFENLILSAGAIGGVIETINPNDADVALVESAIRAAKATRTPRQDGGDDDRARSAAERFLFDFLESVPQTAGRFELNGLLDFKFGNRWVEVDLLCRSPRIAIEIDGFYHFAAPENYRRDRLKDWELQRRGFIVLRFLAEDVVPLLEIIRDRVLAAMISAS